MTDFDGPTTPDVLESGRAYADLRQRLIARLRLVDNSAAATTVPACPHWTIKDTAAHLAGVQEDILAGRIDGIASDAWTAAQVDRFRDASLSEILDAWEATASAIDPIVGLFPPAPASQMVFDAVSHELDIMAALGEHGDRDSEAVRVGSAFALVFVDDLMASTSRHADLVPFVVDFGSGRVAIGAATTASPVVVVSRYDFMRSVSGRRSREQVRPLGLPDAWWDSFMPLTPFALSAVGEN